MNVPGRPVPPAHASRLGLRCVLLALPLWLSLVHLPAPASIEIFDARPMILDYAVRHGVGLGTQLPSDHGPLGALLTPTHSGQPLWVNFWCQVLVGAAFAGLAAWLVDRLRGPARWWLLGGLFVVGSFRPEYTQLSLLLLIGLRLLTYPVGSLEAVALGAGLGVLALIKVQFALLAVGIVIVQPVVSARRPVLVTGVTALVAFLTGWIWSGQPLTELPAWLGHGFVPTTLRHPAAAWSPAVLVWASLACGVMGLALVGTVLTSASRRSAFAAAALVLVVLCQVWRQGTGQPGPGPQLLLTTVAMAGLAWSAFQLFHPSRRWLQPAAAGGVACAVIGLHAVEPRILTESIIILNRKMVDNAAALADRPAWQRSLNDSLRGAVSLFALPRIKAETTGHRTDLLGNASGYALVNRLEYAPRPGPQAYLVDPAMAVRNAAYYRGPSAPDFVVQRMQAFDRGLPALEDALSQLALYEHYDFQFEENGFVLWRRQAEPAAPVELDTPVWHGKAAWNQPVNLPVQPGRAYWLKIAIRRSLPTWARAQLLAPHDPTLVLQDSAGGTISYRASPESLATGFLLNPLFRGETDLVRYQAGETTSLIREVTLQQPAANPRAFAGPVELSLSEVPAPPVSGRREGLERFAERFRISDRLPVAVNAYFPPKTVTVDGQDILLAHPDSSLEFPVYAGDVRLAGRFGLLPGAYQQGGATDGVEFAVEYVPAEGPAIVLWRRELDPVNQPGDRGIQAFSVDLPQPVSGRVILRTQNLPGRNTAWDWSLWTDLQFQGAPATK